MNLLVRKEVKPSIEVICQQSAVIDSESKSAIRKDGNEKCICEEREKHSRTPTAAVQDDEVEERKAA